VGLFRIFSSAFALFGLITVAAFIWFMPWVFTLHLGILAYFPYAPRSDERFLRITGPNAGSYAKSWVDSTQIPKACKMALVAAEDTKFFIHYGIDFESIEKSYEYNQRKNKPKRGGSTITQQLVKNAFLSRNRSYIRKAREVAGAVLLDATASKDMQLTWYFNVVEFGPKIYGIKDAAQFYFKKSPKGLTPYECASLVAILPSPNRWNKSLKAGAPSGFLASRISTIQARMRMIPTEQEAKELLSAYKNEKKRRTSKSNPKSDASPDNSLGQGLPTDPTEPLAGAGDEPPSFPRDEVQKLNPLEIQAEKAEALALPEGPADETYGDIDPQGAISDGIAPRGSQDVEIPPPSLP
jgi:monofunctional biosynthetic peptidoglycan transglycosylase